MENPTFLKAKRAQNTQEPSDLVKMLDKSKRSESFLICFERERASRLGNRMLSTEHDERERGECCHADEEDEGSH